MLETETKVQRYERYKDSGVEWLGDIPEHWQSNKLKYVLTEINERSETGEEELLSLSKTKGVIPKSTLGDRSGQANSLIGYKKVYIETLVINKMQAVNGLLSVSKISGITSPDYSVYKTKEGNDINYFGYLLNQPVYLDEFKKVVTGVMEGFIRLYTDDLYNIKAHIPPLNEQTSIAEFLDDKTTKINQAIAIKEQQISLLKERKQILIHKAVTRGLDDRIQLKYSGVEWIGEIPEHWNMKRFRYVFNLGKGLTITKENLRDEGVFCVNYGEIHSKYGFELDTNIHKLKYVDEEYLLSDPKALLKNGDFVFADTSEDIEGSGNFTYLKSDNEIFAGYHTVVAKPKFDLESRFFAYIFESESFRNQIRTKVKGVKVYSITQSILKQPTVWFPSKDEQKEIVDYLDSGTKKIETAISLKQQEINKLTEYKSSLINGVVTGKVKVC